MVRKIHRFCIVTSALTFLFTAHLRDHVSPAFAGSGEVVINSWGGSWTEGIIKAFAEPFEQETGIKVIMITSPDPAKVKVTVQAGNPPQEDILDYNYAIMRRLLDDKLLEPIDYSIFDREDLAQLTPILKQEYGLGWAVFAWALAYDKRIFRDGEPQPVTWKDYFDAQRFPGRRMYFSLGPVDPIPEFPLIADGVDPKTLYPIDIDRTFRKLDTIKSHVVKFPDSAAQIGQLLTDKEVVMGPALAHRIQKLIDAGVPLGISYHSARLQAEYFMVPKGAKNKANAMKFLAYVIKAKRQADWAIVSLAAPVNSKAFEFIKPETAKKFPTHPDTLKNAFWKNEEWYAAKHVTGKTNRERIVEKWNEWRLQ